MSKWRPPKWPPGFLFAFPHQPAKVPSKKHKPKWAGSMVADELATMGGNQVILSLGIT